MLVAAAAAACADSDATPVPVAPPAAAPAPAPKPIDQGLADAQAWLASEIRKCEQLDVRFDREPVDLITPVTIDFEYAGSHGGGFGCVRLSVGDATTKCERISSPGRGDKESAPAWAAHRAEIPTASLRPLLDAVRALSMASVIALSEERGGASSYSFFILVRVCGAGARGDRLWDYAGFESGLNVPRYAAVNAVLGKAITTLEPIQWQTVAAEEFRRTHFADAFARNRDLYGDRSYWGAMERFVHALGWFGDASVVPTLTWVRENVGDLTDRHMAKVVKILDAPSAYLEGPPREVSSK